MKIGHKLTLGFVGLTLLIAAIGYVALRTSQTTLEKAIGQSSADLAEQVLDTIDRAIYRRVEEIQAYATDELMQEHLTRFNTQFENLPDPNGYIEQVEKDWTCEGSELTPVMVQLTSNKLAMELLSRQNFYENKYGYHLLGEIFVTNQFGANVAQTNKTTDYYQADEQWWQIARRDGLFISDVQYDESSRTFSTEIAVRIDDASGNFLGVIKAIPNIRETINIINEAKATAEYKTMQLHLVNKEAKIIYSTKGYRFLEDVHDQLAQRFGYPDRPEHKYYVIGKKTGEKGILFAHAHSLKNKDFEGLGLTLIIEAKTDEIFAPIAHLRNTMLLAGLAVMGLALLASSITYRSIVVPVAELQDMTIQIAGGNLDTNLTKTATGEIGQLANCFQRMAQQLKKTFSDLNDEIAERKKTEEKLRDNQRFLDNIFDSIQDGIDVLDKDLNVVKVNAWKEKMHANTMPLVGKKCFEAFHQRQEVCPSCPSVRALNTGKQQTEIISNVCADNQTRWLEITAFPFKDADGNSVGVIEHVKDITVHKHAEEALRESEGQLRTIIDNMQTGIFIIDPETHTIVDANPVAARLVGIQRSQLVGSTCHKYICPAEKGRCPITDLGQTVDNAERVLLAAKGEKRPIIKTVVTIMLNGRKHLLESFVDITERKKTEQALEKLNKDLEATIQELSQSNRQLQDFVHIAAHDLKTPVRGIGTLADWLLSDYGDKFDKQGREQIRLLKARVVRIDKLIGGMLQFSKIVRTRQNERQTNLNTLVSEVINKMKPPDNIEIAVDSLPGVTGEREHISQVFQSLLSNAVTFMDKPKGLIKVGCVEQGEFWKFYISDNGPGIEQKYFERIFRIFQTLPQKGEPETAGTGLAVAKKIIELYGGKIWVESQSGSGSTFFFTFPKQQEETVYANAKAHTAY